MHKQRNRLIIIFVGLALIFGYRYFFENDKPKPDANFPVQTESNLMQTTELPQTTTQASDDLDALNIEQNSLKTIEDLVAADILKEVKEDGDVIGWMTDGDLFYGMGSKHGNRVYHVFAHLEEDTSKPVHSVFLGDEAGLINLLDEAWEQRDTAFTEAQSNGNRIYDIDMDRVIGTDGEEEIRIVVRDGTNRVISAYPRD